MPEVSEYTSVWSGFQGSPGYTKFRFNVIDTQVNVDAVGAAIRGFWSSMAPYLRTTWTVQVQPTVQVHDVVSGLLLRETAMSSTPAVVTGTNNTAAWAGGVGAMIHWGTGVIFNGHRVQGRTFLVPLAGVADVDGTISSAAIAAIGSAAQTLLGAFPLGMVVWSKVLATPPGVGQVNGNTASINSAIVRDKTGILRSRRD